MPRFSLVLYQIEERSESNPGTGAKVMKTSEKRKIGRNPARSGAGFASIFFCLLVLNGCVTTESFVLPPEPGGTYKMVKISRIVLRNGEKIDCSDKRVFFEVNAEDSTGMFAITRKYNMLEGNEGHSAFSEKTRRIPLSDVLLVYRDVEKVDGVKTTFSVLGVIAGSAAGALLIAFTLGIGGFAGR